jgi:glucose-1-phosphate cytidylyltransferase
VKVALFCGGLGTRIRDYAENVPKPMVPVGQQPILWHVMQYYSHYGHRDFVLCLGYKANVIKEYFLNYRPTTHRDFIISEYGSRIEVLGEAEKDWRIALIDTGLGRNIGGRLLAIRSHLSGEDAFMANYSDGVTDAPLDKMIEFFERSGKIGCFLAVQPNFSYHLCEFGEEGQVLGIRTSHQSEIWINGGFFIFKKEIFEFMREGEELVLEPFQRLIDAGELVAYKHHGFWASMDTLKDKQMLEDHFERGKTPWLPWLGEQAGR